MLRERMSPESFAFWRRHIVQGRLAARLLRTALLASLAWLLGIVLTLPLNEELVIPHRGDFSLQVHRWLSVLAHMSICMMIFFVLDATVFCIRFVHGLRVLGANWPHRTLKWFERKLDIPRGPHLDNWIDLQFVALRTRAVGGLIYYPFIVLSLMLLSRNPVFDDWYMPKGGVFLAVSCALIALSCAMGLRVMAERSRRHALAAIDNDLLRAAGGNSSALAAAARIWRAPYALESPPRAPTARQLELLRERVEDLRDGAFAPFSQQPLLKALLLPFATFGGTTLLDYMALANL